MSLDKIYHTRSIYGIWDLLGDIGGLFDMLRFIAGPITALSTSLLGFGLDQYLISALFKKDKKPKRADHSANVLTHIKSRKPPVFKLCSWLYSRRNKNL